MISDQCWIHVGWMSDACRVHARNMWAPAWSSIDDDRQYKFICVRRLTKSWIQVFELRDDVKVIVPTCVAKVVNPRTQAQVKIIANVHICILSCKFLLLYESQIPSPELASASDVHKHLVSWRYSWSFQALNPCIWTQRHDRSTCAASKSNASLNLCGLFVS